jgi:hypothetical protein
VLSILSATASPWLLRVLQPLWLLWVLWVLWVLA